MNAFELYEIAVDNNTAVDVRGAFDAVALSANELIDIADAYDVTLSKKNAETIIKQHNELQEANDENGQFSNNYYHIIESVLSEIEI